jgi:hypothetical protein
MSHLVQSTPRPSYRPLSDELRYGIYIWTICVILVSVPHCCLVIFMGVSRKPHHNPVRLRVVVSYVPSEKENSRLLLVCLTYLPWYQCATEYHMVAVCHPT